MDVVPSQYISSSLFEGVPTYQPFLEVVSVCKCNINRYPLFIHLFYLVTNICPQLVILFPFFTRSTELTRKDRLCANIQRMQQSKVVLMCKSNEYHIW